MQPVGVFAEGAAGDPGEGEELPAVGVAGDLQADAGDLHNRKAAGALTPVY